MNTGNNVEPTPVLEDIQKTMFNLLSEQRDIISGIEGRVDRFERSSKELGMLEDPKKASPIIPTYLDNLRETQLMISRNNERLLLIKNRLAAIVGGTMIPNESLNSKRESNSSY